MNIFGLEVTKAKKPRQEPEINPESIEHVVRTMILPFEYGREVYPTEDYLRLVAAYRSWVYICASKNAQAVANAPLKLYVAKKSRSTKVLVKTAKVDKLADRRLRGMATLEPYTKGAEELEEVQDHPFLEMVKKVNPFIDRFHLWEGTQTWLELTGNAYWYVWRDRLGVPRELWPLPPQYMRVIGSREEIIAGYVYQKTGEKVPFDADEIIHFKFFNPDGSLYGIGPLRAIMDSYIDDQNIRIFESTLMKNMGRPEGVLQSKEPIGEQDLKRIRERWRQQYGGAKKVGQTLVLENGLEYKPITFTPREMNYVVGRRMNKEEIAAAFGVPMSKLTTDDVNRSNAQSGNWQYQNDTIEPRLRRIEETLNSRLMPMFDENLFVAYDSTLPQDKSFELQERTAHLGAYVTTVNEEREKLGMEEVDWGDVPLAQAGIGPLGSQQPAGGLSGMPGGVPGAGPEGENEPGVGAIDAAAGDGDLESLSDEELEAGIAALGGK